jgi:signal transduction histidine kinase
VNDEVGVGELVRMVLEQLRPLSDSRRLAVHVESGDNCLVQTDPARLLVALRLGLLRAIQQSPTGGKLEVSLSTKEGSACLTISATAQQAEVYSPPDCAEIPERESQRVLVPDSEEGDWTPLRRAVEALGGSVLIISAETPPLICKICLPLSAHEG